MQETNYSNYLVQHYSKFKRDTSQQENSMQLADSRPNTKSINFPQGPFLLKETRIKKEKCSAREPSSELACLTFLIHSSIYQRTVIKIKIPKRKKPLATVK